MVAEAVRQLLPWRSRNIGRLCDHLALSDSQLRRRPMTAFGVGPESLQRTPRFQGSVALDQASVMPDGGIAALSHESGYADQARLTRECQRLTGLTPGTLRGRAAVNCSNGHDRSAGAQRLFCLADVGWAPDTI